MEASLSPAAPTEIHLSAELLSFRKEKRVTRDHNFLSFNSAYKYRPLFYGQTRGLCRKNKCVTFFCSQKREFSVVEGRCIDDIYDDLAKRILPTAAAASDPNLKHIVGLAGPPGSGKTTIASEVVRRINMLWPQKASSMDSRVEPADVAAVLPMDGFHLYRSQLDAMENPEEAHARRGAPWTFNPQLLLTCLKTLRNQGSVYAPSFDHGVGDPVEDDIFVSLQHKVVIVEGNYLLLDDGVWKEISSIFDEKWFIEIDINKSMQRVLKRHISTGKPLDVAKWRIEYNDRPNAELIMKSKKNADLVIRSIDF
ncbi:putative uridine kinase C227.14 isoform X1 [Momordica charantia]|uniref:Uridine kinase C227.14 isoform X1 n=1 Tax=Momordica charantia TaxID=3673 RepID=A0A6J1CXI7_MOMCH|nr:putative uridine kinase C227.14 isoform X1 [Momordica charantia]